jgi:hypothetical protein
MLSGNEEVGRSRRVQQEEWQDASKLTEEEIRAGSMSSLEAQRTLGPEIQWLQSFVTDYKIYCIYYAPDESLIREHAPLTGLPVSRVEAVRRLVDPSSFE